MRKPDQYLVALELRYNEHSDNETRAVSNKITIAVCDTFSDACDAGNAILENMESSFPLHVFPLGDRAKKRRLSPTGGPFNRPETLITELAYLKTPFVFFLKITTLKYKDVSQALSKATEARRQWVIKKKNNEL